MSNEAKIAIRDVIRHSSTVTTPKPTIYLDFYPDASFINAYIRLKLLKYAVKSEILFKMISYFQATFEILD